MTLYRPRGLARVQLNGHTVYLGPWGTDDARVRYDEVIAQWLAAGRTWPPGRTAISTVGQLAAEYTSHARTYYVKHGRATNRAAFIAEVSGLLAYAPARWGEPRSPSIASLPIDDLGPLALRSFMLYLAASPDARWSRSTINEMRGVVVAMMKWAVSREHCDESAWRRLTAVPGLGRGRTPAPGIAAPREGEKVCPPPEGAVERTRPLLKPEVRAMVDVQLLTGMRPTEVCGLRPCHLKPTPHPSVVAYHVPADHNKLDHAAIARVVYIGPRGMEVLRPFMPADSAASIFSPARSEEARRQAMRAKRRTPLWPSHTRRIYKPRPTPRPRQDAYTTDTYRRCIQRTIQAFNAAAAARGSKDRLPSWAPNQLRHAAASHIAEHERVEVAQILLGHSDITTTMRYVHTSPRRAVAAAAAIG